MESLSLCQQQKCSIHKLLNHIGNSLKIQPSLQGPLYHIMSLHYLPSITLFLTVYLQPNKELFCKVPFTTFVSLLWWYPPKPKKLTIIYFVSSILCKVIRPSSLITKNIQWHHICSTTQLYNSLLATWRCHS